MSGIPPPQGGLSSLRDPGAQILANGVVIPGVISLETTVSNYYQAAKHHAQFALYADEKFGLDYWGNSIAPDVIFDFQVRETGTSNYTSMMTGEADKVTLDPVHGTVEIEGRDLSARLIDHMTQETFLNQTSSQVATTLAARRKLTADVDATSQKVGRYWKEDHDHIVHGEGKARSEWDLLVYLAQIESFDVWVTGNTLHFKNRAASSISPFILTYQQPNPYIQSAALLDIHLERSLTLAKDVVVSIHFFDPRTHRGDTIYDPPNGKNTVKSGKAQQFVFYQAGITHDRARQLAASYREDISRHEKLLTWSGPGSVTLDPRQQVQLRGAGLGWDQLYWIDSISRRVAMETGFTMDVRCKNHSPASQSQVG